ncbi:MAG TPA: hypothetical protein VMZ01_05020 [Aestuariivirga sp.]|nr:hypothetical protein [Aestuariivirga sp.]
MAPADDEKPQVKSTTPARAGVTGHNVRYVLFFGLGGVIVAFIVVGLVMGWWW